MTADNSAIEDIRTHVMFKYYSTGVNKGRMQCAPLDAEGNRLIQAMNAGQYTAELDAIRAQFKFEADEAERKAAERKAKVDAIEGVRELESAYFQLEVYRWKMNAMMDDEYNDGVFPPKRPPVDINALRERYPRAAAYVDAKDWSDSLHHAKSAAGMVAVQKILDGQDYEQAIADMHSEWNTYSKNHTFD